MRFITCWNFHWWMFIETYCFGSESLFLDISNDYIFILSFLQFTFKNNSRINSIGPITTVTNNFACWTSSVQIIVTSKNTKTDAILLLQKEKSWVHCPLDSTSERSSQAIFLMHNNAKYTTKAITL